MATRNDNHLKSGYVDEHQLHLEELHAIAEAEAVAGHAVVMALPQTQRMGTRFTYRVDELARYVGGIERA